MSKKSNRFTPFWMALCVVIGILVGTFYANHFSGNRLNIINSSGNKLNNLLHIIDDQYVDTVNINDLVEKAMPQILAELDPHSVYITARDGEIANDDLRGSFFGIGIEFVIRQDTIRVQNVIGNGPAERAGMMAGDKIVEVDDSSFVGKICTNEEAMHRLKGPKDTKVKLGIIRYGEKKVRYITITRGEIPTKSVTACYMIDDETGYIKMKNFGENTYPELLIALAKLAQQGFSNLVIDLRGNTGGYLESAVQIANEFLSKGQLIVYTEGYIDPSETKMDGVEARNYGELMGMPACRRLFADLLGVKYEQVFIGGSASLELMYNVIAKAYTHGLLHSPEKWAKLDKVKFLCPAPGYDRHFTICETFGMEMITVPLLDDGPDMDMVEELVKDPEVKGMWCVPKYSNPDGVVFSEKTVSRIANLKPAAPDFLLMWDNAYCVHEFDGPFIPFLNILEACRLAGNPDMVFEFASTSKITFPGAGVSCFCCSEDNMAYMKKLWNAQIISYDKLNQLRHVKFFGNAAGVLAHMKKHAAVLKPKFDIVLETLEAEIAPLGIATWHKPKGGYFVSLNTMEGCAKRVHELCKNAGVVMTGAGATFPYKNDPKNSNLRIAPSFPPCEELAAAMQVLCTAIKLAALEKLLTI